MGDLRLVTVLFADIAGFTSLSERLDPEAVRNLITACFERVVPCIERYGGTVDKFIGDEVMALFGAPQAHENDPERALRAALEMREALAGFNREHGVSLGLHFGVNTGLVYAGAVGGGSRQDYSVMGDAVNVAARLKAAAKAGEILVGQDTYRLSKDLFEFRAGEALTLKGKNEPVTVYRLRGTVARVSSSACSSRGLSSPMVGREAELAAFKECLARLRDGAGGILVVTGEAGLGKSRLVADVRSWALTEGFSWLEGRTLSFGRTISYWPLLEIIQQDTHIEGDDSDAERWTKLSSRVGPLFGTQRGDILPYLAALLNVSLPDDLVQKTRYLDGEAMGRQIYRASRLYFARLAEERPAVIVFEDVHWLDASSASLLEHLLPLTRETPILFCLVSRPESESPLNRLQELARGDYPERLTELDLKPLSPEESGRLASNLVNVDDLPSRLRESIIDKAEGNPFYVEEVARSLIDQGALIPDPVTGRYRVTDKARRVPIPDTLHGVIMARIDRLDDDLKQVLRLASVVGRGFFYRVLAAVAEAEQELDNSLCELEARELIREKARTPELEYMFKHALVQEATYESILFQRRKEIHRRVALAIESLFAPERLDEFYSLLAYHYSKAEDWEKAQEYLFKAGDQAGSIAADAEALAHYEEAVEAYARVFGDKWDPLDRAVLERKIGEALYRRGEHAAARDHLYVALRLLSHPVPTTSMGVHRAVLSEVLAQVIHRLFPPRFWRRELPEEPRAFQILWTLLMPVMQVDVFFSSELLVKDYLLALNAAERSGVTERVAAATGFVGTVLDIVPLRSLARSYHERANRLAAETQDPVAVFGAHVMRMIHRQAIGDWDGALQDSKVAVAAALDTGDAHWWAEAYCHAIMQFNRRGDLGESLERAAKLVNVGTECGDRVVEAWGRLYRGSALSLTGDLRSAEAELRQAMTMLDQATDYMNVARTGGWLGLCLLRQGRIDEARDVLQSSAVMFSSRGLRCFVGTETWNGLALVAIEDAENGKGLARKQALEAAKRACRPALAHGKLDVGALLTAYRCAGTYHFLAGHPRRAGRWWDKSLQLADRLGARYEGAITRLEMGRRLGDPAQLEQAVCEFEAMGAQLDLTEAHRLLGRSGSPEVVART